MFDWFDLIAGLGRAVNDEPRPDNVSLWGDPNIATEANYRAMQRRMANEHIPPSVPYLRDVPRND